MLQKIRNRKGFTLVELMIVVAIIGILAAIAIPNFLQFRLKAKTSEAKSNLGAIRSTEVAYFAEWNFYVGNQAATPGHSAGEAGAKKAWVTASPGVRFSIIGFAPEGSVYYDYTLQGNNYDGQLTGFTTLAAGDLDGDGLYATFTTGSYFPELLKTGADF